MAGDPINLLQRQPPLDLAPHHHDLASQVLQLNIPAVKLWAHSCSRRQVGLVAHDAKAAREARHSFSVDPMRKLACGSDALEHLRGAELMHRQPVVPFTANPTAPYAEFERYALGAARRFLGAHALRRKPMPTRR